MSKTPKLHELLGVEGDLAAAQETHIGAIYLSTG